MKFIALTSEKSQRIILFLCTVAVFFILLSFLCDSTFAVTVDSLKAPIKTLKESIFGGWMVAVKICAAATGIIFSVFKGSLAPFGIGAGLTMGIHLYDGYLGDAAVGALI